jgi:hypothetical protein
MTDAQISWGKCLDLAQRGFDRWAEKPHNKKWARRIDGTPIKGDLLVCIAWEVERGFRETPFEERQARIYCMERRIRNQRAALKDNWQIIEMRARHRRAWLQSPLLKAMLKRGTKKPASWWARLFGGDVGNAGSGS